VRKKWEKVIEKWEILGNSGKNCDSGISLKSEQKEPASEEVSKFHFAQKIFILNWALAGAIERKKCKKLQFVAKIKKQKLGKQKWEINSNTEGRSFGREAREPARPDVSNAPGKKFMWV